MNDGYMIGVFIGAAIVVGIVFIIDPETKWHNKIVEAGHGEYNRTTGEFQFLEPCKDK